MNKRQKNKKSKTKELRNKIQELERRWRGHLKADVLRRATQVPTRTLRFCRILPNDIIQANEISNAFEEAVQHELWRELEKSIRIKCKQENTPIGLRYNFELSLRTDQFELKKESKDE